ncbi:MAG: hypothetical protein ABIN91_00945 [Mucilaginibacter sp.]|uniref:hypothetical protein n=1 Tax=Mucilaginibacter sp. TaxID=1882438 RepID=UPI00326746AD
MFPIIALLLVYHTVYAQTDTSVSKPKIVSRCTPSRGQIINPPLYLVFDGKKQVLSTKNPEAFNSQLNPHNIKSINVLKGAEALKKYGDDGQFGVVETYLKRGKHLVKNHNPLPVDTLIRYRR